MSLGRQCGLVRWVTHHDYKRLGTSLVATLVSVIVQGSPTTLPGIVGATGERSGTETWREPRSMSMTGAVRHTRARTSLLVHGPKKGSKASPPVQSRVHPRTQV